ncbi:hypothetical protein FB567DRAFT_547469 [Paraphoma chrysanthemicola]|uniref:Uncharacterized protein n=1 Tax=Paraphoma chrysanthemicola TaxID=798071 RepID=A0A8K0RCZ5_9PLEO|nr:hypothetical protein FB567DRAFT_547469 [Paraphoma chrysanthemicola]
MHFILAIVSLATLATAVPINTATDGVYGEYASYKPYASYGPYAAAADEAAAKMGMQITHMKRTPINMAEDTDYTKYASYKPYTTYGPYAATVDEEAAKMGMAMGMGKRAANMMHEASMMSDAKMVPDSMGEEGMKRDMMDPSMHADMMTKPCAYKRGEISVRECMRRRDGMGKEMDMPMSMMEESMMGDPMMAKTDMKRHGLDFSEMAKGNLVPDAMMGGEEKESMKRDMMEHSVMGGEGTENMMEESMMGQENMKH